MDSIKDAQKDMRTAYFDGFPGILASGLVWLTSGFMALMVSPKAGMLGLVLGGMLIFPLSVLLCKLFGCSGQHDKANPLAPLAFENTFWMLLSIPIAVAVSFYSEPWFYPAMLLIIAGRYLTFNTLYGTRLYYLLAGLLVLSAWLLVQFKAPVYAGGLLGGAVEIGFALLMYLRLKNNHS